MKTEHSFPRPGDLLGKNLGQPQDAVDPSRGAPVSVADTRANHQKATWLLAGAGILAFSITGLGWISTQTNAKQTIASSPAGESQASYLELLAKVEKLEAIVNRSDAPEAEPAGTKSMRDVAAATVPTVHEDSASQKHGLPAGVKTLSELLEEQVNSRAPDSQRVQVVQDREKASGFRDISKDATSVARPKKKVAPAASPVRPVKAYSSPEKLAPTVAPAKRDVPISRDSSEKATANHHVRIVFNSAQAALAAREQLKEHGDNNHFITKEPGVWKLYVGAYKTANEAWARHAEVKQSLGVSPQVILPGT